MLPAIVGESIRAGSGVLLEPEAKALLEHYGIKTPARQVLKSDVDPATLTASMLEVPPPWALKIVSPTHLHKSDVDGVRLSITTIEALREAVLALQSAGDLRGLLLESMAAPGQELVVGGARHPRFGPMLLVGLGGVYTEILNDVALRICPVTRDEAGAMLDSLRGRAILEGARGRPAVNREALVEVLWRIGGPQGLLVEQAEHIAELDVNPLIVSADGAVAVDARAILAPASSEPARSSCADVDRLLAPNAVAVAGASGNGKAYGNQYIRNLKSFGFRGPIYAVHPSATEIDGCPAYPTLAALPQPVDYAFVAVGAEQCAPLLRGAEGRLRFAQVMSSGFGEGETNASAESQLLASADAGGVRILGPNCLGTHAPHGRLTFIGDADNRPGGVAVIAQSGGLSMDTLRRGRRLGLRFRGVVSVGNCADLGPAELIDWFTNDPETHVIGLYLEDARRGRALFERLRAHRGRKPIALLVGGRSAQGARAARSHTGAMAGDERAWEAFAAQTGLVLTDTLDEFLRLLLAFQTLSPKLDHPTREVVLFGNGGGASVLATDAFSRAGLAVTPLAPQIQAELGALDLPNGASVANPIDVPANVLQRDGGRFAHTLIGRVFEHTQPGAFVIHVNVPVLLGYTHLDMLSIIMDATLEASAAHGAHIALVLRADGDLEVEAAKMSMRERALARGIVVYDEVDEAADALAGVAAHERLLMIR